jgi:hypothetical protein
MRQSGSISRPCSKAGSQCYSESRLKYRNKSALCAHVLANYHTFYLTQSGVYRIRENLIAADICFWLSISRRSSSILFLIIRKAFGNASELLMHSQKCVHHVRIEICSAAF